MIYREWRIKVDWTRDIVTKANPPHFIQNDTHAVRLTIDMVNDRAAISASTNYRLMVLVVRPDGQAVIKQADWIDENTAELILDQNMLAVPGKGRIHLGLFGDNGERLTHEKSLVFIVGEDPGFCDDDTIVGTTEYGILSQLIQEVKDIQTASQLHYTWDGDRLGIKRVDEEEFTFSPSLTGPQGPKGDSVESLPWDKITGKPPLLENAQFPVATTSANGLMSAADKTKLNGIAAGAEVNQNAFTTIKVGSSTISADSKTDTLEIAAGTGITITTDTTNDKITINGINQYTHPNHTGDVTSIGDGVTTISNNVVTNAKLADMASNTVKGRKSSSTGDPEDISISDLKSMLELNNVTNETQIPLSQKGVANGVAELDASGKVPSSITGNADGNAATATKLQTARTISLSGDVTGSANFDGSSNISISATVASTALVTITIKRESFVATAGQTVFNLTTGTYTPGNTLLDVFVNGIKQPNDAYTETDSDTITFKSGLEAGDMVLLQWLETA